MRTFRGAAPQRRVPGASTLDCSSGWAIPAILGLSRHFLGEGNTMRIIQTVRTRTEDISKPGRTAFPRRCRGWGNMLRHVQFFRTVPVHGWKRHEKGSGNVAASQPWRTLSQYSGPAMQKYQCHASHWSARRFVISWSDGPSARCNIALSPKSWRVRDGQFVR